MLPKHIAMASIIGRFAQDSEFAFYLGSSNIDNRIDKNYLKKRYKVENIDIDIAFKSEDINLRNYVFMLNFIHNENDIKLVDHALKNLTMLSREYLERYFDYLIPEVGNTKSILDFINNPDPSGQNSIYSSVRKLTIFNVDEEAYYKIMEDPFYMTNIKVEIPDSVKYSYKDVIINNNKNKNTDNGGFFRKIVNLFSKPSDDDNSDEEVKKKRVYSVSVDFKKEYKEPISVSDIKKEEESILSQTEFEPILVYPDHYTIKNTPDEKITLTDIKFFKSKGYKGYKENNTYDEILDEMKLTTLLTNKEKYFERYSEYFEKQIYRILSFEYFKSPDKILENLDQIETQYIRSFKGLSSKYIYDYTKKINDKYDGYIHNNHMRRDIVAKEGDPRYRDGDQVIPFYSQSYDPFLPEYLTIKYKKAFSEIFDNILKALGLNEDGIELVYNYIFGRFNQILMNRLKASLTDTSVDGVNSRLFYGMVNAELIHFYYTHYKNNYLYNFTHLLGSTLINRKIDETSFGEVFIEKLISELRYEIRSYKGVTKTLLGIKEEQISMVSNVFLLNISKALIDVIEKYLLTPLSINITYEIDLMRNEFLEFFTSFQRNIIGQYQEYIKRRELQWNIIKQQQSDLNYSINQAIIEMARRDALAEEKMMLEKRLREIQRW